MSLQFGTEPALQSDSVGLTTTVRRGPSGELRTKAFKYSLDNAWFGMEQKEGRKYSFDFEPDTIGLKKTVGRPWEYAEPIKCYGFPEECERHI